MAHFAQVVNGIVTQCLVVSNEDCNNLDFPESEQVGQKYLLDCGFGEGWVQTSYNGNFRKQYANTNFLYDSVRDEFVSLKPFPSWSLDSENNWQAPIPKPDGDFYWDEISLSWIENPIAE